MTEHNNVTKLSKSNKHPIVQAAEKALEAEAVQHAIKKIVMMATVLSYYTKEGGQKQRHLNLLMESPDGNITKADLQSINQSTIARLVAENGIAPGDVTDIVIMGVSTLGMMTDEEFYGKVEG